MNEKCCFFFKSGKMEKALMDINLESKARVVGCWEQSVQRGPGQRADLLCWA